MRGICGVDKLLDTHRWPFLEHTGSLRDNLEAVLFVVMKKEFYNDSGSGVLSWRNSRDNGFCYDINAGGDLELRVFILPASSGDWPALSINDESL